MKLKHRLQIRFVLLSVLALVIMQTVIVGLSLGLSYRRMSLRADRMILLTDTEPNSPQVGDARYFSVTKKEEGLTANVSHTALVTQQKAMDYARQVFLSGKSKGYMDGYRFLVHKGAAGMKVTFLSAKTMWEAWLSSVRMLSGTSAGGIAVMAVFLAAMSSRVVTPLVKNRQQQKEFITSASHALKTPVTVIQADAQMLEAEAGENEWTADILSQTRRMAEMTQRLVYLARLEEQDGSTEKLNFPLSDALQQVCDAFWGIAKEYGTQYSITIVPQIDFRGDEKAIRELMNVLLDNAFKYTPAGGSVAVQVKCAGRSVKICVENTAEHVTKEQLERLTGRFIRGSECSGGFGIGLSVAKAVAENHGGRLTLELPEQDRFRVTVLLRQ